VLTRGLSRTLCPELFVSKTVPDYDELSAEIRQLISDHLEIVLNNNNNQNNPNNCGLISAI